MEEGHRVLDTAVDTAVQSGMIACVAAGNSGPRPGSIESPSSAQLAFRLLLLTVTGE